MIDDLTEFAIAATADAIVDKAAKRHKWVRVIKAIFGCLFLALIGALFFVTVKYS